MKNLIPAMFLLTCLATNAQEALPYREIPEASNSFTAGTVAARQIDGLGFRFYWATEGLKDKDFSYKIDAESRSTGETLTHIFDLSQVILSAALKQEHKKVDNSNNAYADIRKQTLLNLKKAADILREADNLSDYNINFGKGKVFPYWNAINGPISDAIWHCGQIASFRRASGNPISSSFNHFTGKVKTK